MGVGSGGVGAWGHGGVGAWGHGGVGEWGPHTASSCTFDSFSML